MSSAGVSPIPTTTGVPAGRPASAAARTVTGPRTSPARRSGGRAAASEADRRTDVLTPGEAGRVEQAAGSAGAPMIEAPHAGEPERDVVVRVEEHARPTEEVRLLRGEPEELRAATRRRRGSRRRVAAARSTSASARWSPYSRARSERPAGAIGQEQGGVVPADAQTGELSGPASPFLRSAPPTSPRPAPGRRPTTRSRAARRRPAAVARRAGACSPGRRSAPCSSARTALAELLPRSMPSTSRGPPTRPPARGCRACALTASSGWAEPIEGEADPPIPRGHLARPSADRLRRSSPRDDVRDELGDLRHVVGSALRAASSPRARAGSRRPRAPTAAASRSSTIPACLQPLADLARGAERRDLEEERVRGGVAALAADDGDVPRSRSPPRGAARWR